MKKQGKLTAPWHYQQYAPSDKIVDVVLKKPVMVLGNNSSEDLYVSFTDSCINKQTGTRTHTDHCTMKIHLVGYPNKDGMPSTSLAYDYRRRKRPRPKSKSQTAVHCMAHKLSIPEQQAHISQDFHVARKPLTLRDWPFFPFPRYPFHK